MAESRNGLLKVAFWILGAALLFGVVIWFVLAAVGLVLSGPLGIVGLILLFAVAVLIFVVVRDRMNNKDDDYYDKNIQE